MCCSELHILIKKIENTLGSYTQILSIVFFIIKNVYVLIKWCIESIWTLQTLSNQGFANLDRTKTSYRHRKQKFNCQICGCNSKRLNNRNMYNNNKQ